MEIVFKTKNEKQIIAAEAWIDEITEEILYGGGKGGGKSYLGVSLIFGDALIYPETHYFIARQELTDLRKFTIPTIHEVFKNWGIKVEDYAHFNGQDNCYNLTNGSKVFLLACKYIPSDPLYERFGSMQMTRGMIEEGGEIEEDAKSNLALSIGRWKNEQYGLKSKLLITANPKKGWMKRDFVEPFMQGTLPRARKFIKALVTDNKYMSADYVTKLSNEKDTVRRQRLFEGNWDYEDDQDSLVSFDALSDAFSNTLVLENQKYLMVDVARKGKDSTVYGFFQGLQLYKVEKRQKQSIEQTKQTVKDFASAEGIPFSNIMVDEDGVGGGVVDGLLGVKGFIANSKPIPTAAEIRSRASKIKTDFTPTTNYANLKAQCAWKLAELINEHKAAFKVPDYREEIIEDLTALLRNAKPDDDGKLQLKPKTDVKRDLGHSPDVGDMIIFRAWYELQRNATPDDDSPERSIVIAKQKTHMARVRGQLSSNK